MNIELQNYSNLSFVISWPIFKTGPMKQHYSIQGTYGKKKKKAHKYKWEINAGLCGLVQQTNLYSSNCGIY